MGLGAALLAGRKRLLANSVVRRVLDMLLPLLVVGFALALLPQVEPLGLAYFLQTTTYGIANGAIYALIAIGYTMVYGIVELINFPHGDVFTLGIFASLSLLPLFGVNEQTQGPLLVVGVIATLVVTMALCGLLNVLIERVAYRPLRNAPRLSSLISAVGTSFLLEGVLFLWKGPYNVHYPDLLPRTQVTLLGVQIGFRDVFVVLVAAGMLVALASFVGFTKLGKAMRATAQDRDAAYLMGIDVNRTIAVTFFIGALLAGAGGVVYGLYYNTATFDLGFTIGLVAFTAAVFGGIGNINGAAVGGLLIGLLSAYNNGYFQSVWTQVLIFGVLITVLVFRPNGLLGMQVPHKG